MQEYISETPVASLIFLFTLATSIYAFSNHEIYGKFMLHPYSVHRGSKLYTLITSGLIHADYGHLFFNMFSYYSFAFILERLIGHWQFAILYFVSMVLSDLSTILKHKDDYWYNSLGASGAISAVVFSFIMYYPMAPMGIILLPIRLPAVVFGGLYLLYSVYASKQSRGNINHDAHYFGALAGIIITIIFNPLVLQNFIAQVLGAF
jgi:membrane associated rhomboid family serine protease